MALTVLNVAYPLAPVGPDAVGGAEQIVAALDAALVRAGHRSLVVACAGSSCAGELVATPPVPPRLDDDATKRARGAHREAITKVLRRESVDVVHLHGLDFPTYLPRNGPPLLATLHLPPAWYPPWIFGDDAPPELKLCCVSKSQHAACPPSKRVVAVVGNGVDLNALQPADERGDEVVALGRVCPEKGFHLAADATRRVDLPFVLGGRLFPYEAHVRYFREVLEPRLDERRRFAGPLSLGDKARVVARARCLVVPSLVAETSSLAVMEALACGTPVVAFRAGALPELIQDGRTGFVVEPRGLEDALLRVDALDRAECRRDAERRFSVDAMCAAYFALYEALA